MRRGFSLVSVMVAIGLAGTLVVFLSQVIKNARDNEKGVSQSIDFSIMKSRVNRLISDKSACDNAFVLSDGTTKAKFGASVPVGQSVQALVHNISGNSAFVIAENDEFNGLTIEDIYFRYQKDISNIDLPPIAGPAPNEETHRVELMIRSMRGSGTGSRVLTNTRNPFVLEIVTDTTSDEILRCGGGSVGGPGFCVTKMKGALCPTFAPNAYYCDFGLATCPFSSTRAGGAGHSREGIWCCSDIYAAEPIVDSTHVLW